MRAMGADQKIDWAHAAASTLAWWHDAGVDTLIDEAPRNWLAVEATPATPPVALRSIAPAEPVPAPLPTDLPAFEAWRIGNDAPEASVPGARIGPAGSAVSGLMIVVEMPDREDMEAGQLLSGMVGRLFDRMLAAIGRDRQSIYLAAMCVVRPPSGRLPPADEAVLADILRHHVALVAPHRLLIFGNAPSRALLGADAVPSRGILRSVNHAGGQTSVMTSFHPRLLLERPTLKAEAWKDLQMIVRGIES